MPPTADSTDNNHTAGVSHVRANPGMYFGDTREYAVRHCINELVSNGIDLYLHQTATRIDLRIEDDSIRYSDDGPGLPFDQPGIGNYSLAEQYLSLQHKTPTADSHAPHIHLTSFGLGMACVNAVSERFSVKSWRSGNLWEQAYSKGVPSGPPSIAQIGQGRGTQIDFALDREIFDPVVPCQRTLRRQFFETAHLFPGVVLGLDREVFHSPGGLADLAFLYCPPDPSYRRNESSVFAFHAKYDDIEINVGLSGNGPNGTEFRSWANGFSTCSHGTHVTGLRDALRAATWVPSVALIHVILLAPEFASPVRNQLENAFVRKAVREAVKPALLEWVKFLDSR